MILILLSLTNIAMCLKITENEVELDNILYKHFDSRVLPSDDLNTVLINLFGHTNCNPQLLQSNSKLKHLKSISTCLNCRLSINEKGFINGVKELNYESKYLFKI
jgi:hypothetical protein